MEKLIAREVLEKVFEYFKAKGGEIRLFFPLYVSVAGAGRGDVIAEKLVIFTACSGVKKSWLIIFGRLMSENSAVLVFSKINFLTLVTNVRDIMEMIAKGVESERMLFSMGDDKLATKDLELAELLRKCGSISAPDAVSETIDVVKKFLEREVTEITVI